MESLESNFFNCANESRGFHNKKSVHNVVEGRVFLDIIILDFKKKVGLSRFGKLCFRTS